MGKGAWLGFIFFVALLLLGFGTILIGRLQIFARGEEIEVLFPSGGGLRPGDEVRVDGIRFGEVKTLNLAPDGAGVLARLSLREPVALFEDMIIQVESLALLGGNYVSILRGDGPGRFGGPQPYQGRMGASPFNIDLSPLENLDFAQLGDALQRIADAATTGNGTIARLMNEGELYDTLTQAITEMRDTFAAIREGDGAIADLVNNPETRDRVQRALENGDAALANLRQVLEQVAAGEGTVGRMLTSDEMYTQIQETLTTVRTSFDEVREAMLHGDGAIGTLMSDETVAEDMREAIRNFRETAENFNEISTDLRAGQGTLGQLLTDDTLINDAQGAIQGLNDTFGRVQRTVLQVRAGYNWYTDREYGIGYGQVRIWPDENKLFLVGGSVFMLNDEGDVPYRSIATRSRKTEFGLDVQLGWRLPWLLDRRLLFRGGVIEGQAGAGFEWDPDHPIFETQRLRVTLEGRGTYDSVGNDHFDEDAGDVLVRAFVSTPLWERGDDFLGTVLGHLYLHAGVNSILEDPEFMIGIGLEYEDSDIRSLFSLAGLAN